MKELDKTRLLDVNGGAQLYYTLPTAIMIAGFKLVTATVLISGVIGGVTAATAAGAYFIYSNYPSE